MHAVEEDNFVFKVIFMSPFSKEIANCAYVYLHIILVKSV